MKKYLIFLFPIFLISDELALLLEEADKIIRDKKLNLKDMPSTITLLQKSDFDKVGARTLIEALSSLPNVEISISSIGWNYLIIRGYKSPNMSLFDKVKIFIDGVPVNELTTGSAHFYLNLPIELIERIEVFRGANSSLYGNGAYAGAISVITKIGDRSSEDSFFIKSGSSENEVVGFNISKKFGYLETYFDGYSYSDKSENSSKGDLNRGENSDENLKSYGLGLNIIYRDFEFSSRYKSDISGNFFGSSEIIENEKGFQKKESLLSKLSYKTDLDFVDIQLSTGVNIFKNSSLFQTYYFKSENFETSNTDIIEYSDRLKFIETKLSFSKFLDNYFSIGLKYEKWDSLNSSYLFEKEEFQKNYGFTSFYRYRSDEDFVEGKEEEIYTLYFQNLYSVNQNFDISLSGRVDKYLNYGDENSFQLGSIYRFSDMARVKGVYNRAYRLPSWNEESDTTLEIEKLDGLEIAFIYENLVTDFLFEINLFRYLNHKTIETQFYQQNIVEDTNNHKHIVEVGTAQDNIIQENEIDEYERKFKNSSRATENRGVELNLNYRFNQDYSLNFNYGYVDTEKYHRYLSKLTFSAEVTSKISFYTYFLYVDEIDKDRVFISEYLKIDETLIYKIDNSSTLKLYIKNIFNSDIYVESFTTVEKDGLKRDGREIFISYIYDF